MPSVDGVLCTTARATGWGILRRPHHCQCQRPAVFNAAVTGMINSIKRIIWYSPVLEGICVGYNSVLFCSLVDGRHTLYIGRNASSNSGVASYRWLWLIEEMFISLGSYISWRIRRVIRLLVGIFIAFDCLSSTLSLPKINRWDRKM